MKSLASPYFGPQTHRVTNSNNNRTRNKIRDKQGSANSLQISQLNTCTSFKPTERVKALLGPQGGGGAYLISGPKKWRAAY